MQFHNVITVHVIHILELHHILRGQVRYHPAEHQALGRHGHGGHGRRAAVAALQVEQGGTIFFGQHLRLAEVEQVAAAGAVAVQAQVVGLVAIFTETGKGELGHRVVSFGEELPPPAPSFS